MKRDQCQRDRWTVTVRGPSVRCSLEPGEAVGYEPGLVFNVADTSAA